MTDQRELGPMERWRLVLGEAADGALGSGDPGLAGYDAALAFLYDREGDLEGRGVRTGDKRGGDGPSALTVPEWLDKIHALFPKETIERLEQDAVERYGIDEVVTNPDVLERVEPNPALLRAVLRTKHLMDPALLALARKLVQKVVRQLLEKLQTEVRRAFSGSLDRRRSSPLKSAKNLDLRRTIRQNLEHWDPKKKRLVLEKAYFFGRTKRHSERWQVILLVDQSGSMLDSTIHSAIMAACFWGIPGIETHLIAFDTSVVDLTADVTDPVELLMKVQLGGGTDIAQAVRYGAQLVKNPRRTIVVLVTDFYEGGDVYSLYREIERLTQSGAKVLGLAALDQEAQPVFDRDCARECVARGAKVGAMTPGELASFIAETVRG
ncbi:MAG: VWA domain-containing protein [Sandaracinaceae bacterium]|nr:VWA domain-containing protein [Sandaracinaceae bacterium]